MTDTSEELLSTARKNLRYFISASAFKCEADRTAGLHCVDVLEDEIDRLNDLVAVLRSALAADARIEEGKRLAALPDDVVEKVARAINPFAWYDDCADPAVYQEAAKRTARKVLSALKE